MDLKKIDAALQTYIRPQTFPLAVKMVKKGDALPEKVKLPKRDFKKRLAICQVFNMARRTGWVMAVSPDDQSCPIGSVIMGFKEALPYYTEGNLAENMYTASLEAGKKSEEALDRFSLGEYEYLLTGPLTRADFTPDFIYVYCDAAQLMRLVQAALYKEGGALTSSFSGRGECSEAVVTTILSQKCQVVLPGNGERVFGHTQDHEMAFTIPFNKVEEVVEGLEMTHKFGVRYPIPALLDYEVTYPPKYQKLEEMWNK